MSAMRRLRLGESDRPPTFTTPPRARISGTPRSEPHSSSFIQTYEKGHGGGGSAGRLDAEQKLLQRLRVRAAVRSGLWSLTRRCC